ncbi:MAG: serine/threonine-protein kinase [Phycisphaerales bacterium]|nr:protein kinase [Planctomycetota bacterium]
MAVANQCSRCGVDRPTDAPGTLCPGCAASQSPRGQESASSLDAATSELKPPHLQPPSSGRGVFGSTTFESVRGTPRAGSGGTFGEYEIRRELGRGGMGIVYEARHLRLDRPVALKMMRSGLLAGEQEHRRFLNEAQSVARLDHPGIVSIYEVGEHNGQSFLAMRLVTGGSLVSLLDRFKANPRAATEFMVQIAEAISHAHMRGILHRDLKPANILVDETGNPHITDFGLAKQVESDIEITQSGAIVGTPAYMAPEQASGKRGGITTATDIYGLGAVFYTLLTGRAPFSGESVVETLDAVRHAPPSRPSGIAAGIPRDLETICLKCLEKDPKRRYPSAQALADDLRAWLDSRPIAARRVRASERVWLWCKRKPALAGLLAISLCAVVGGTVAIVAVQAASNRVLAAKNTALADANRESEQRFSLAMDAIKSFYTGVSDDVMLRQKNLSPLRKSLLESARGFYQRMEKQLEGKSDRASRTQLAQAYHEIAKLTNQIDSSQTAIVIHEKALALRSELNAEPGAGPDSTADLADSYYELAQAIHALQQYDKTLQNYSRARDLYQGLVQGHPDRERYRIGYIKAVSATVNAKLLTSGASEAGLTEMLEVDRAYESLCHDFPETLEYRTGWADLRGTIAYHLSALKQKERAQSYIQQTLRMYEQELQKSPRNWNLITGLAQNHFIAGISLPAARSSEAADHFRSAISSWETAIANVNATYLLGYVAAAHDHLAKRMCVLGLRDDEIRAYEQELAAFDRASRADPSNPTFVNEIADCLEHIATYQIRSGLADEAVANSLHAVRIREDFLQTDPANGPLLLGVSYDRLGDALLAAGRVDDAHQTFEKCLGLWQKLAADKEANPLYLRSIAVAQRKLGQQSESGAKIRRALELLEAMPRTSDVWLNMARCRAQLYLLSQLPGSGVSHSEGEGFGARAVEDLRQAYLGKYATLRDALMNESINPDRIEQASELDPLRSRSDFQALLTELRWQSPQ